MTQVDKSQTNINPSVTRIQPYQPGKPIAELTRELGITDIVKLASNENPRGPGERVLQAVARASQELPRYPDGFGFDLKSKLAERLHVPITQITLGNGSNEVIDLLARAVLQPGSEAIVSQHAFIAYKLAVFANAGDLITVPAQNFGADLDAMLAAITDKTRLIFLANPNNPTGTWVNRLQLKNFLDKVPERVWVLLDEAYFEYVQEPEFPDGVSLLGDYANLIVTRTFSKIHGLAALRVGYACGSERISDLLNRARLPFNLNSIALAAARASLEDDTYQLASRELNTAGISQLTQGLAALDLTFIPPMGNFVTFEVADALNTYQSLLKLGVIVRPVAEYELTNFLRVTVGLAGENERFLTALTQVL